MSLGVVASVIAVCASLRHIHVASVVLVLLLTVLIIADRWGFLEAVVASALGCILLDYFFLPPAGFRIESIEYWLVFVTFLGVALLASYAAARARRQTDEAVARRREVEKLHALAQELRIEGRSGSIVVACLDSLVRIFQVEAAMFLDLSTGEMTHSGSKRVAISKDLLHNAVNRPDLVKDNRTGIMCVALHTGGQVVGTLAVSSSMSEQLFRAVADRIENGLEKVYSLEKAKQAEETRRNQELKTALLDSLVHEVKTPLSVIKTAASSLLSRDSDVASRRELLTIINEEADRMDASISEAFWTARVSAGALQSGKAPHDIKQLVMQSLEELAPLLGSRSVTVEVPEALPPASCDFHMIKGVLKELLTNALKYSPPDSPLTISVRQTENEIVTSVADFGIGVRTEEQGRIFEKHYRGRVQVPGTGLGLAIAKTIVEAHGGQIGVSSQPDRGSVFRFSLPVSRRDAA